MFIVECHIHGDEWQQVGPTFPKRGDAFHWADAKDWGDIPMRIKEKTSVFCVTSHDSSGLCDQCPDVVK